MDSVEVDATVKSQHHSLSKRDTGLYEGSTLRTAIIDLDKLNPDTDGDGNLSASEVKIYNLLRAQDTDGDGKLTVGELYNGLAALTKVEKNRSRFKKGFFMMSAVSLIQVLLIVGLVAVIFVALKDQFVAEEWGEERLVPVYPVSASLAQGRLTLPELRFVCRPDELAFTGTEPV